MSVTSYRFEDELRYGGTQVNFIRYNIVNNFTNYSCGQSADTSIGYHSTSEKATGTDLLYFYQLNIGRLSGLLSM